MSEENLEGIKQEAEQALSQIKVVLDSANAYTQELELVKEDIKSKRQTITQIYTNAQNKGDEVERIQAKVAALEMTAKELVTKIEGENTKLTAYMATFEALREKLDDDEDGLDAVYTQIQEQNKEIKELLSTATTDTKKITEHKATTEKYVSDISTHKKDVEGYRGEIEKIYGYINGQGLAHSFSEREKALRIPLVIWSVLLLLSSILVSWALYVVFQELPLDPETSTRVFDPASLFYRLSFVSPLLLIFFVALRQYSRERRLLESYAFKAATAKALESYTEILARRFPEEKYRQRVLAFVLHAMVGIYRHPNNELNKVDDEKEWFEKMGDNIEHMGNVSLETLKNMIPSGSTPIQK